MEDFPLYYRFVIYLLVECVKYGIPFEALYDLVSAQDDLTDLFQVLFLPSIFTYLTSKNCWFKLCAVVNLIFGLFLNVERLLIVLASTVIWFICVYFLIRGFNVMSAKRRRHNE